MIKGNQLREFYPVIRERNSQSDLNLEVLQETIFRLAAAVNIPVAFQHEEVNTGGTLTPHIEPCVVMYHPDHQWDYFQFCIRISREGAYTFISVNNFGQSRQMKKMDKIESYRANWKGQGWGLVFHPAFTIGSMVGSAVGQGITSIGVNKHELEEEQKYYQCIIDILDELFVKEYDENDLIWKNAKAVDYSSEEAVEPENYEETNIQEKISGKEDTEYDENGNIAAFVLFVTLFGIIIYIVIASCL